MIKLSDCSLAEGIVACAELLAEEDRGRDISRDKVQRLKEALRGAALLTLNQDEFPAFVLSCLADIYNQHTAESEVGN